MNHQKITTTIEDFIKDKIKGLKGGVVGLSGGIDSTLVAYLAVRALGKEKVYGLVMPYGNQNCDDGIKVAEFLKMPYEVINIQPIVDSFRLRKHFVEEIPKGNLMARVRMCWLYGIANEKNMLVLGTSNKSEIETGYFTKYGDGGVDIEPIGDLYKTEVWELARYLGVPEEIINKTPSAGLWEGQTDEEELGVDYYTLDRILRGDKEGIEKSKIKKVEDWIRRTKHKRELPPIIRIER